MPKRKRLSDSGAEATNGETPNPQSPKKMKEAISQSPIKMKQRTPNLKEAKNSQQKKSEEKSPKAKTPKISDTDDKQTPKSQKVTLKSPKTTPKQNQNTPVKRKGTPHPKRKITGDDDKEETVQNANKKNTNKRNKKDSKGSSAKKAKMNGNVQKERSEEDVKKEKQERDARSLFLKNYPLNFTKSQVKALSPDIVKVRLNIRGAKNTISYAFVQFESPAKAKLNYNKLQGKKIGKQELHVDFVKRDIPSEPVVEKPKTVKYDKKRLYVGGPLSDVTEDDIRELFPKMRKVVLSRRHAFVSFEKEEDCKLAASRSMQKYTIKGNNLLVMYAKRKPRRKRGKKGEKEEKTAPTLKKEDTSDDSDDEEEEKEKDEDEMDVDDDDEEDDDDDDDDDDDE